MTRRIGYVRGTLLVLLPLAAFAAGPLLRTVSPVRVPTVLPLVALAVVAGIAYRRTRSATVAIAVSGAAFTVAAVGVLAFAVATFPSGH